MYLIAFPLLLIPFAFFNIVVFLLNMPLRDEQKSAIFTIPLASEPTIPPVFDRTMPVTIGDLIVAIGILLLYVELIKAVRPGGKSMVDHVLSLILFLAMAGELLFVPRAASATLLLLTVLGFVDFIAGLSVRFAQPKVVFERVTPAQPAHQASDHP
ncbi:MAG: hypothetical protein ACJ8F0_15525 [Xanthobacteraceae bacterium]|jgi:hypothetical protein